MLFHLPLLQMFPECGTEIFARRPSLAASYCAISRERTKKTTNHCMRFSLASLNETFLTVPYFCLWAKVYMELLSVVTTLL